MDADDAVRAAAAAAIHARMGVVGSDGGGHVGVAAGLEDGRIRLAQAGAATTEPRHAGEHRRVPLGQAAAGRAVRLSVPAAERALRLGMAAVGDACVAAGLDGTIADPAADRGRIR